MREVEQAVQVVPENKGGGYNRSNNLALLSSTTPNLVGLHGAKSKVG